MRTFVDIAIIAGVASLASACSGGLESSGEGAQERRDEVASISQALTSPGYSMVAWEELTPAPPGGTLAELKAQLPQLQGRGVALVLHWKAENLDDAARWGIVNDARARGIAVYPWLTLPNGTDLDNNPSSPNYAKTGYFPNATNYAEWIAKSKQLMALWSGRGLPPTTLIVDLEMRKNRLHQFADLTSAGADLDLATIEAFLREGINRTRYASALQAFKLYVNDAHRAGFKVSATTLLAMLDDYGDDDDDLRQAFGVPLDNLPNSSTAIAWDDVSFQVQRTLYQQTFQDLTSYFVQDYALLARILFGSKAGVGLGLTHGGILSTAGVYPNGTELRLDVQAALNAGVPASKIGVYSFLGMYTRPPLSQWFQAPQSSFGPFPDIDTGLVHLSFWTLDGLLDD